MGMTIKRKDAGNHNINKELNPKRNYKLFTWQFFFTAKQHAKGI
jgi:hypothetical protein